MVLQSTVYVTGHKAGPFSIVQETKIPSVEMVVVMCLLVFRRLPPPPDGVGTVDC